MDADIFLVTVYYEFHSEGAELQYCCQERQGREDADIFLVTVYYEFHGEGAELQ